MPPTIGRHESPFVKHPIMPQRTRPATKRRGDDAGAAPVYGEAAPTMRRRLESLVCDSDECYKPSQSATFGA